MLTLTGFDVGRTLAFGLGLLFIGCRCTDDEQRTNRAVPSASIGSATPSAEAPRLLYLPDGSFAAPPPITSYRGPAIANGRCPAEMVDIAGHFCIDRYEAALFDAHSGQRLSPYYHPTPSQTRATFRFWREESTKIGPALARAMPVPPPPDFQLNGAFEPEARSLADEIPNGYLNAEVAALACARAGKRLCREEEWVTACKGEAQTNYPYGDHYQAGVCNVFRARHPAVVLHADASSGHLDPRLNLVEDNGVPLLRRTGASGCSSRWGADAVYDMVGNLDEWVDDPKGKFLGGFFSRSTRDGCYSSISAHPRSYFDYSLGVRCCL